MVETMIYGRPNMLGEKKNLKEERIFLKILMT